MLITRRAAAAASAAVLAVLLTACDSDQVGAAAIVGDDRITVNELQDKVREVYAVGGDVEPVGDQAAVQNAVLNQLVRFRLADRVEADTGIEVTGAQIDAFIDEVLIAPSPDGDLTQFLVQNQLTDESLRQEVRLELIRQQLGTDEFLAAVALAADEEGVTVNPRYGVWEGVGVTPESGSVSIPVDGLPDIAS